ncbi:MAG: hypothetical protein LBT64_02125 [Puniceicoccales bacterium]|nr:hypothetical protein [Puniceicoccales bacterium]
MVDKVTLCNQDIAALNDVMDIKISEQEEKIKTSASLIDAACANKKMADRAVKLAKETKADKAGSLLKQIAKISGKISPKELGEIVRKLEVIVVAAAEGKEVDQNDKLTWPELRKARSVAYEFKSMECGLERTNSADNENMRSRFKAMCQHSKFLGNVKGCYDLYDKFNTLFMEQVKISKGGDIAVVDTQNHTKSGHKDKITDVTQCINYGHTDVERENRKLVGATTEDLALPKTLDPVVSIFTRRYAIDPSKLLKPEYKNLLQLTEQDLWNEFHSARNKTILKNYCSAKTISISAYHNVAAFFHCIVRRVWAFLSKYTQPDSEKWATPLSNADTKKIVTTCSGFAAMVIVESLIILENDLRRRVNEKLSEMIELRTKEILGQKHVHADSAQLEAEEQIRRQYPELYKFVKNKDHHIFNLPFRSGTDLSTIIPSELLDLFNASGALAELPQMEIIEKYLVEPN